VISCRVRLDVPVALVWFVSGLLAARRREIGTRKNTRSLGCYRQAVFGLAWFRDRGSVPRLGAGFGLSQATAYRYLDEVTGVLAERAPDLREALERALADGAPYVILEGTPHQQRPVPGENHRQPVQAGNRRLVLREGERLRRQHPGPVLSRRPADVGLGRAPGPGQ
jgi:hypothetical protein